MAGFVRNFSSTVRSAVFLQSMVAVSVTLLSASTQAAEQEIAPSAPLRRLSRPLRGSPSMSRLASH